MEGKKVVITFGKDGSVQVEAFGYVGTTCEEATAFLDELFGKPENKKLKDSYHAQKEVVADGLPSGYCG